MRHSHHWGDAQNHLEEWFNRREIACKALCWGMKPFMKAHIINKSIFVSFSPLLRHKALCWGKHTIICVNSALFCGTQAFKRHIQLFVVVHAPFLCNMGDTHYSISEPFSFLLLWGRSSSIQHINKYQTYISNIY